MMDFQPPQTSHKQTRRKKAPIVGMIVGCLVVFGAAVFGAKLLWFGRPSPIPKAIISQMPSAILVPKGQGATVKPGSVSYVASEQLAQFTLQYGGQHVQFSEQPAPAYFAESSSSDSNNAAAQNSAKTQQQSGVMSLVQQLNRYAQFDTDTGTVYLTHPAQLAKGQMAVLSAKGTVVYATSSGDMSQQAWQQLFKDVAVLKE